MSWITSVQSLALLAAANTAPLFAERLFGQRFNRPLDSGVVLPDGRPLFGRSKTIRGILAALVLTLAVALLAGVDPALGVAVGACAMLGDLFSSFLKRRLNVPPSGRAFGLDQVPESLLPLLVCRHALRLTGWEIAAVTGVFVVGEVVFARLFYRWHLRDRPY